MALVTLLGGVCLTVSTLGDFTAEDLVGDDNGVFLRWLFLTGSTISLVFDGSFLCDLLADTVSPGRHFSL